MAVTLTKLVKTYGEMRAVDDVSITIRDGEKGPFEIRIDQEVYHHHQTERGQSRQPNDTQNASSSLTKRSLCNVTCQETRRKHVASHDPKHLV